VKKILSNRRLFIGALHGALLCLLRIAPGVLLVVPHTGFAQSAAEEELIQGAASPVRFRGEVLFEVRAPMGKLEHPERAKAIEDRLAVIAAGTADALDQIQVVERDRTSDLMAGEHLVLSVADADAAPFGRTRQQLAADYALKLHAALDTEFSGRSAKGISTAVVLTVLATIVLVFVGRGIVAFFRRAVVRVRSWEGTRIPSLHLQGVELLSARRVTLIAARTVALLRWVTLVIALVVYLETILGFFPWTRAAAVQFRAYVMGALASISLAILNYLPNLVYIALIIVVVRFVLQAVGLIFDAVEKGDVQLGGFHKEWAQPSARIVRFLIIAFSVVITFPYLPGAQTDAFKGVSIFLGVLFSLGSSSAVANVVAGVVMTYMIPFRPGDRVKIGETVGDIVETNMLVVRVRTIKNVEITIPNASVLGGHIVNYSRRAKEGGLILHSTVTIGYDVPWRSVHALLIAAAKKTAGLLDNPEPFVLQTSLDDFYVSYQINATTDQPNRMAVIYGELHQHIQDGFAEAGVEIMSPHYRAVRDGGMITLPSDQLPADYVAPAMRITTVPGTAVPGTAVPGSA
jgi:small-conductance mechanosensitive channel